MHKYNLIGLILIFIQLVNYTYSQINPLSSLNCQFDNKFCEWTTTATDYPLRWVNFRRESTNRNISFNGAATGPGANSLGYYIQIYIPNNNLGTPNQDLVSQTLNPKTTTDCFSFYYYIHGEGVRQIELYLVTQGAQNWIPLWTRKFSAGDMWHLKRINIGPSTTPFKLRFIISSGNGAVGLSSFTTSPGICSQDSICDFESGNCNWTSSSTSPNYQFKLISASNAQWPTLPNKFDHTTETENGHFMEAAGGTSGSLESAELISPVQFSNQSTNYCLRFWYWRYQNQSTSMTAMVRSGASETTVWTSNNAYPKQIWHRALANAMLGYDRQIVLTASQMVADSSAVDIDDISLSPNTCPQPVDCDFNIDMCGWTRSLNEDWIWDQGIGRVERSNVLPTGVLYAPADRTAPMEGMYMYTDFTQMDTTGAEGTMIMQSEYVTAVGQACLTFYYLPLSLNSSLAKFEIFLNNSMGNNKIANQIFTYDITKDPQSSVAPNLRQWIKQMINITATSMMQTLTVFRINFRVISRSPSIYVAVDDITYRPGLCPPQDTTMPTQLPSSVQETKITTQLPTTVHTTNEFRCTFEAKNNCSFTPLYNPNNLHMIWTVSKGSDTFIKTADHTLKTFFGHFYALDFNNLKKNGFTTTGTYRILSEFFRSTPQTCVTFSYYMTGQVKGEALNFYMLKEDQTQNSTIIRPLWKADGDLGPFWYSHRMTINSTLKWRIGFDVTTHDSEYGLIAIDDVIVELDEACPPKGICDFERKDTCMWESIQPNKTIYISQNTKMSWALAPVGPNKININYFRYTDFEWEVYSNDYAFNPLYPERDHTLNVSGNYLLMRGESHNIGDRALLVSDDYNFDDKRSFCLNLFYYSKSQSEQYSKFEVYQSEGYYNVYKIGQIDGRMVSPQWTQFNVTARAKSVESTTVWFYLVGDVGAINSIIAIDDISITSGDCVNPQTDIFKCDSGESIPKSRVCDGRIDCRNGADEINCGKFTTIS